MTGEIERIAAEVERLEGPSREMDCEIAHSLGIPPLYKVRGSITATWPDYTASLDAAMTLVSEGAQFTLTTDGPRLLAHVNGFTASAATPALALCAAALKACAHLEQHHA